MTTLKEAIEAKISTHKEFIFEGKKWLRADFKQDLLPILLEMAQALEVCVNIGDTRYRELDSNGQEFEGDMAVDALSKLEQWARGE